MCMSFIRLRGTKRLRSGDFSWPSQDWGRCQGKSHASDIEGRPRKLLHHPPLCIVVIGSCSFITGGWRRRLGAGGERLEAEGPGWRWLEAGGWRLEVGGWRLEKAGCVAILVSSVAPGQPQSRPRQLQSEPISEPSLCTILLLFVYFVKSISWGKPARAPFLII